MRRFCSSTFFSRSSIRFPLVSANFSNSSCRCRTRVAVTYTAAPTTAATTRMTCQTSARGIRTLPPEMPPAPRQSERPERRPHVSCRQSESAPSASEHHQRPGGPHVPDHLRERVALPPAEQAPHLQHSEGAEARDRPSHPRSRGDRRPELTCDKYRQQRAEAEDRPQDPQFPPECHRLPPPGQDSSGLRKVSVTIRRHTFR